MGVPLQVNLGPLSGSQERHLPDGSKLSKDIHPPLKKSRKGDATRSTRKVIANLSVTIVPVRYSHRAISENQTDLTKESLIAKLEEPGPVRPHFSSLRLLRAL